MKTKNPRFQKMYNAGWIEGIAWPRWSSPVWRQAFSGRHDARLPANTETLFRTVVSNDGTLSATIMLKPMPEDPAVRRKRNHRTFTQCDKCQNWVHVGRIDQHMC